MQSFVSYKNYCDKETRALPLQEKDACYILQSKVDHPASTIPNRDFRQIGPYVIEEALPNDYFVVTRINTNKIQICIG